MHDILLSKFIVSIVGAIASGGVLSVAQVQDVLPPSWVQSGAGAMLVGCLATAVVTLWKNNQNLHKSIHNIRESEIKEREEREAKSNRTNQELIAAIRNLKGGE